LSDLAGAGAESKLDPVLAQRISDDLSDRRLLARQEAVGHLDDRHAGAKAAQELAELDSDRAAAQHDHTLGELVERRCLAVRPEAGLREPGYLRHARVAPGGEHDALGLERSPVDLYAPRPRDARLRLVDIDPSSR
jgi:hypothetical protein